MEMAVILADGEAIATEHLPVKLAAESPGSEFALPDEDLTLEDVERRYIEQVFRRNGYHKLKTAAKLGIARKTLDRKLQQYDISKPE